MSDFGIARQALTWFDGHREQFVADLLRWLGIPSVSDASAGIDGAPYGSGVADMFAEAVATAERYGLAWANHEGFAMSVYDPDHPFEAMRDIAMVSHLDVVPAGPGWESEPFAPYERDGFVVGRGADDNKGMALLNLYLLRYWKEKGASFRHPVRVMYGGAEETGLDDMREYVRRHGAPYQAIVTDCGFPVNTAQKGEITLVAAMPKPESVISLVAGASPNAVPGEASVRLSLPDAQRDAILYAVGAMTGMRAAVESDGTVTITATGRSGHAAFPEGTVNALHRLTASLMETDMLPPAAKGLVRHLAAWSRTPYGDGFHVAFEDDASGTTTLNLGLVRTVGHQLQMTIDVRHAVTQHPQRIVDDIASKIDEAGGHVDRVDIDAPYVVAQDDPRVALLTGIYNKLTGSHAEPYAMGGGTHARVIPNALNFGPGLPSGSMIAGDDRPAPDPDFIHGGAHGPNEWTSVDRLRQAFAIYAAAIPRLDAELD
ncbi:Sapep family Mn(2+)-dependent dipeptidase [Bifidobacterium sp. 82T10]|uniref:Sapep family Mn(2+)-dependent dipeptidase n=2 Tax=Bifidobacterium miconis TaxID=2834435 RepID=A0ABS6WI30_9BIFI|nr:Sapep family Mn(2+)-dependent dipeptidase [Bifidobacterium miconis]